MEPTVPMTEPRDVPFTDSDVKAAALRAAGMVSANVAMGMNRRERRQLSRKNNGVRIPGSTKPFMKEQTKRKEGVMSVD